MSESRRQNSQSPPIALSIGQSLPLLEGFYGRLPMPPAAPFQYFIWEALEAFATPAASTAAFMALRRLHALTPDAMHRLPPAKLEAAVALAGPYHEQRIHAIRHGATLFRRAPERFRWVGRPVRDAVRAFRELPRFGEHDTRRMLLFVLGCPVLPIDQRVHRIAERLGFSSPSGSRKRSARVARKVLSEQIPATAAARRHALVYLTHHATLTCTEREPHCQICPLRQHCPEGRRRTHPLS